MGKGGGDVPTLMPGPLEREQAKFLKTQRKNIIEPAQQALFAPALTAATQGFQTNLSAQDRQALEAQHNQARSDIMSRGTRGGLMQQMLTNADIARADTVGNAINNARQLGIQRGLAALVPSAFPGAQSVMAGGQAAAGNEMARNQANINAQIQAQQAAGQGKGATIGGLGSLAGGAMMMF